MKEDIKIEIKALWIGFIINLFMGIFGWYMFITTDVDALFLDANFSLISAIGCISAIVISKYSDKETKHFPNGMHFLEPLYATLKAILSLGLIIIAGISAVLKLYDFFFLNKGVMLEIGYIFYYSVLMVILSFLLSLIFYIYNKKINYRSIMLTVESKASFIDGIISLGVGVAILLVTVLPKKGNIIFIYYIADSILTIILIIITLHSPIEGLKDSFIELMNGVIRKKTVKNDIEKIINEKREIYNNIKIEKINIHKMGKKLNIFITLSVLDSNMYIQNIIYFRNELLESLKKDFTNFKLNIIIE